MPEPTTVNDPRQRVVIESISPEIDGGRFPAKRVVGDEVCVEADIFTDGHDQIGAVILYRMESGTGWKEAPMRPLGNDRWTGSFQVTELGRYRFAVRAWIDRFRTWRSDLVKRRNAGQDLAIELLIGASLVEEAAAAAPGDGARWLRKQAALLAAGDRDSSARAEAAVGTELLEAMETHAVRRFPVTSERELVIVVEPVRARFSAWYEMFPRSASPRSGRHGTLRDVEKRLPYVARLGFDVVYLPPIHPIGGSYRKGPNNALEAGPDDPGSPWAIGSAAGGHKAIHPDLGTLEDLRSLVAAARDLDIEVALDVALQASPDHPYVTSHREWFRSRPDGTIQYAENPPKKYQDIYPLDFESERHAELWDELKSIFDFWIAEGITIFRVDNPHTKSFRFWEWCIGSIKSAHPEAIFLSEAFTRPKVAQYLAKAGFSLSYTYFPWRTTAWEIREYCNHLRSAPIRDYFRPSHWVNTPDILTAQLQYGGRPMFITRLVLAATLGASYGIYGPAFELMESRALAEGSEEYLDSEKYQIRSWNLDDSESLGGFISRVNRIRREHAALWSDDGLRFHECDNESILCYSKSDPKRGDVVVVTANLDPHHKQSGWIRIDHEALGVPGDASFQMHDLLSEARYSWHGSRGYVELDPSIAPAHVFRVRRRVRSEADFEYFF